MQDELLSIKAKYGQSLRMVRKGTDNKEGENSRRTPFPIQIALKIQQPPPAIYDIEYLQVHLDWCQIPLLVVNWGIVCVMHELHHMGRVPGKWGVVPSAGVPYPR